MLASYEKRGGRLPNATSCADFKAWTDSCCLTHIMTRGAEFTWTNGRGSNRTEVRLDRAICNDAMTLGLPFGILWHVAPLQEVIQITIPFC